MHPPNRGRRRADNGRVRAALRDPQWISCSLSRHHPFSQKECWRDGKPHGHGTPVAAAEFVTWLSPSPVRYRTTLMAFCRLGGLSRNWFDGRTSADASAAGAKYRRPKAHFRETTNALGCANRVDSLLVASIDRPRFPSLDGHRWRDKPLS